ncbi:MAG TPA: hypothetical protein VJ673_07730 [Aromatoleum sp.]|uniref:hypothetical protein n=1 Tax=Aromatoleum sp. TaxID=2307007 RepID=UPI002B46A057|nr:hypothetical protein [Aromatoleum sp.]HJV25561.1 hypothetical protein [Aromatoleum sp.]
MPRLLPLLLTVFLAWPPTLRAAWDLISTTAVHPEYKGPVPSKSDVIFSTRFKRPEAPEVARSFGATRIEWVYSTEPEFIQSLRASAPWFGGAISSNIPLPSDDGLARDFEGNPVVAPWMKSWGAKWVTTTSPVTRDAITRLAKRYLELGAKSIQFDDPLLQFTARRWGGDFSQSSVEGFREFLKQQRDQDEIRSLGLDSPNLDYKKHLSERYGIKTNSEYVERQRDIPDSRYWNAYLKQSILNHYSKLKQELQAAAPGKVAISMNLPLFGPDAKRDEFALVPYADYAMVETKIDDLDLVSLQAATYRALGMGYTPSITPGSKDQNRTAISYLYALGGQPLIPWDVYVNQGADRQPTRFFGTPEDYGDLYRFVRTNQDALDNYEILPVVGILAPTTNYRLKETLQLVRRLNDAHVPFVIVPTGESVPYDPKRIAHLKLLISVNSPNEFAEDTITNLRASGVTLVTASSLDNAQLQMSSPVTFNSSDPGAKIVIRGHSQSHELALHIIHPIKSAAALTDRCTDTVNIRKDALSGLGLNDATSRTLNGKMAVQITDTGATLKTTVSCSPWSIIVMRLKQTSGDR